MDVRPKQQPSTKGPASWFTGDVEIDPITRGEPPSKLSVNAVHFAAGARTAWHAHHLGQTLYVTDGEGRVQSRGEAVVPIQPGDVIHTADGEWHWHGASPDHDMRHVSITHGDAEWGEHVTDEEYLGTPSSGG